MKYVFLLMNLVDEDEIEAPEAFTTSEKAAKKLVSYIDDYGAVDEAGDDMDMDDVLAWDPNSPLDVYDTEGRIIYRLVAVPLEWEEELAKG